MATSLQHKFRTRALLIDDEADSLLPILAQHLTSLGFELEREADPARALDCIDRVAPQIVLLDLHFPGDEERHDGRTAGGELLARIRSQFPALPVLVFTTRLDDIDIPLERFDMQPHGYFAKPNFVDDTGWSRHLAQAMFGAIDATQLPAASDDTELGFFVGKTAEMREAVARIRFAAANLLTVLIYGETGSGKRLAAEAVHRLSHRKGAFVQLDCSAVQVESLDATLFGHVRHGSSPASDAKHGLLEAAAEGTLFLDQFHRIPSEPQGKLSTFLDTGTFQSIGATSYSKSDVRLIVATSYNLSDLVAEGLLRADLAYRLGTSLIVLPPLRNRRGDIADLFRLFVSSASQATSKHVQPVLRPETLLKLEQHQWPGNIREFEATIQRAVANTNSNVLLPGDVELMEISTKSPGSEASGQLSGGPIVHIQATLASKLTDHLEGLEKSTRYEFLRNQSRDLQREVLIEFSARLRKKLGRKIDHKTLAAALDPLENPERDLNRIRQFLHACGVKITELEFNR